jgi:EpsI family protein
MSATKVALAMAGLALLACWPSVRTLADFWFGIADYRYGLPIALIALAWLVYAARGMPAAARPTWTGVAALLLSLMAWLVAYNANSQIAHQVLVPLVIWCAMLAGTGQAVARRLWAPVAFLYFAIPVWEYVEPLLQWLSVVATEATLALARIPAEVQENYVRIPSGSFQIVEGCSGKRYFMVTLAVACLAVALNRMNWRRAAIYVACCGGLALLANWIRIFIVILAGHRTHMQHYLVAVEHESFGNGIFVLLLGAVLLLARRFTRDGLRRESPAPGAEAPPAAARPARMAAGAAVLSLAIVAALPLARAQARAVQGALPPLPLAADRWQGPLPALPGWRPAFAGASAERHASYQRGAATVEVYVNLYPAQGQGAELVYYENRLAAPGDWTQAWPPVTTLVRNPAGLVLRLFEAEDPSGRRWLIGFHYRVGAWGTARDWVAQVSYGLQSMLRPAPSGVVALASLCDANCESARALVMGFWDDMSAPIVAMIGDGE